MNNQGRITVFLSLISGCIFLLAITVITVIDGYMAKSKIAMCSRTALSGVMAQYNSYIFEHYHILLFDKNAGGLGEGYIEDFVEDSLSDNLGASYQVEGAAISAITYIWEEDCASLKQQIADYLGYAALEYGADTILQATGGEDGELSAQLIKDIEAAENSDEINNEEDTFANDSYDIRDYSGTLQGLGLLNIVLPADMELSDRVLSIEEQPSRVLGSFFTFDYSVNNKFNSYSRFKEDVSSHGKWKDNLLDKGTGVAYAANVFNCATEQNINETSILKCELEYLICGKNSDINNIKSVVNRIIAIRMPVNYSYLMSDSDKSAKLSSVATSIMTVTGIPAPILKRLLAGAWSYIEAVAEVKNLMSGVKLAFKKNDDNWITDIDNISESMYSPCSEDEHGLSYKDYLLILLSLDMDSAYYRMLDIMQLNVREIDETFDIKNAAVAISLDIQVIYDGKKYGLNQESEY